MAMVQSENAFALVIGISEFQDSRYRDRALPQSESDATDFAKILRTRLGWPSSNIVLLSGRVVKTDIISAFRVVAEKVNSQKGKTILLYCSTHGHPYRKSGDILSTVLLASDTLTDNVLKLTTTGISKYAIAEFYEGLDAVHKVAIFDACFSAAALETSIFAPRDLYSGIDAAVISAAVERAFVLPGARNSVFTCGLLTALDDARGEIGLASLVERAADASSKLLVTAGYPIQDPYIDLKGRPISLALLERGVTLGAEVTRDDYLTFATSLLEQYMRAKSVDLASDTFVPRRELDTKFGDFWANTKSTFVVIGPPGVGKSTSLGHLAHKLLLNGILVLWLSPAKIDTNKGAIDNIEHCLRPVSGFSTVKSVLELFDSRSVVIFIDAINEWQDTNNRKDVLLEDFRQVAEQNNLRLVYSKRADSKADNAGDPTAFIGDFDDEELAAARSVYPVLDQIQDPELRRKPLVLHMLTEVLGTDRLASFSTEEVFTLYVTRKLQAVSTRLGIPLQSLQNKLEVLAHAMLVTGGPYLASARFFALLPEALAVGLLDEGLFRPEADRITGESELLTEYLLSFALGANPFISWNSVPSTVNRTWWGAAAFRVCRLRNPALTKEILKTLISTESNDDFVLGLFLQINEPQQYSNEFLQLAARWTPSFVNLDGDLHTRVIDRLLTVDPDMAFEALRLLFRQEHYYPWERKRWRDLSAADIRSKFHSEGEGPALLLHAVDVIPARAAKILITKWMTDKSPLKELPITHIYDVAVTLLCYLAQTNPVSVLEAIDQSTVESEGVLIDVIHELSHTVPKETLTYARQWHVWGESGARLALQAVSATPAMHTSLLLSFIEEWLNDPDLSVPLVNSIIATLGNIRSRGVFKFLVHCFDEYPEARSGVIWAFGRLFSDFGSEIAKVLKRASDDEYTLTSAEGMSALVSFYSTYLDALPTDAVSYFRRVWGHVNREHCSSIQSAIGRATVCPTVSQFVEEQLTSGSHKLSEEYLSHYLVRYRKVVVEDRPWLYEWSQSRRPLFNFLQTILKADMTINEKADLVRDALRAASSFYNDAHMIKARSLEEQAARKVFAQILASDVSGVDSINVRWLKCIVAGASFEDAKRKALEEELRARQKGVNEDEDTTTV